MNETIAGLKGAGYTLILFGVIFALKPRWFGKWEDRKQSLVKKFLSNEGYYKFMRIMGGVFAITGLVMVIASYSLK